jgi:addiction module HigA family antidote
LGWGKRAVLFHHQGWQLCHARQENIMGRMFNPPHPGATLKEDVLPALGLTVTEAARQLGVTRTALSRVLNGRAGISSDMARRIEAWLGQDRGGRADLWLGMQLDYDLWQAEQKPAPKVERAPSVV